MDKNNITIYNKANLDWNIIGRLIDDYEFSDSPFTLTIFSVSNKSYRMWVRKNKKSYTITIEEIKDEERNKTY